MPTDRSLSDDPPSGAAGARGSPSASLAVLRIGLGLVWGLNLFYILDPANQFFSTFSDTARGFGSTTLGGSSFPEFVAANPSVFSWVIAAGTAYLAVAFLIGGTTRAACLVGAAFNAALLLTQLTTVTTIPGGTDVGPQPLYLVIYAALYLGAGREALSLDRWLARAHLERGVSAREVASVSTARS